MIVISIKEGLQSFDSVKEKLGKDRFALAVSRSINEAIMQGRTVARTAVKDVYNIPQRYLNGININKSNVNSLTASLYANSTPIPMDAFSPKFETATKSLTITKKGQSKSKIFQRIKANPVTGVSIEIIKGQRETVPYAFMIEGAAPRVFARGEYKSGFAYGFVQRHQRLNSDGNDTPIAPLITVSIHGAVLNKKSMDRIEDKINTVWPVSLQRNINYLLE